MTDLVGQRFGLLTVLSRDYSPGKEKWLCQCDCGKARSLSADCLLSGAMTSCGCQTSRHKRRERHEQRVVQRSSDLVDSRKRLSDARIALFQAIHGHDPEEINSARLAFAAAQKRVRDITSRGGLERHQMRSQLRRALKAST